MKKRDFLVFLILVLVFTLFFCYLVPAQPPPPPGSHGLNGNQGPGGYAPLDGGIVFLMLSAVWYGVYKLKRKCDNKK